MGHDIGVVEVVTLWLDGEIPKSVTLWGHHLIFWERFGRIMEVVGLIAVAINLLGADQLNAIATELRDWNRDPGMRPINLVIRPRVFLLGVAAATALAAFTMLTGTQRIEAVLPFTGIALPHGVAAAISVLGAGLVTWLLLAFYFVLFGMVSLPAAELTARFMQRQHADRWLKLFALPLLSLGFLLDLLAS